MKYTGGPMKYTGGTMKHTAVPMKHTAGPAMSSAGPLPAHSLSSTGPPLIPLSTTGQLPINYRSNTGQLPINYQSTTDQLPVDYQSTTSQLPVNYQSTAGQIALRVSGPAQAQTAPPAGPAHTLTVLYHNVGGFRRGVRERLEQHIHEASAQETDEPLIYALVETGTVAVTTPAGWFNEGVSGKADGSTRHQQSGGLRIISHSSCPIERLIELDISGARDVHSSVAAVAIMAPHGGERFLLAMVYVHPNAAAQPDCVLAVGEAIDSVQADFPRLPLLVVGDFNARHPDWHDSRPLGECNSGDTATAAWIGEAGLHIHNPPSTPTRVTSRVTAGCPSVTETAIDLVLSQPAELVADISQQHSARYWDNDHIPFTIRLELNGRTAPAPPPRSRPRVRWDVHRDPGRWQRALPAAMARHITPLRTLLVALDQRVRQGTDTPQSTLEAASSQLEAAILAACTETVGLVGQPARGRVRQLAWWTREVDKACRCHRRASKWLLADPHDGRRRAEALRTRRAFKAAVRVAKQEAVEQRATCVMDPDSKLRYATLRTYRKSPFSPLTGIRDSNGSMPASHTQSLDNLTQAFVRSAEPPAQAAAGSAPGGDRPAPAPDTDDSDSWVFTAAEVEEQTKRRTCKTAAGPDAVLPLFLRYGGKELWAALAAVYNYSWRHSVTPQAWREANVTALYKGKGSRSEPLSYRPISVTSGIARTFEHLIQVRLAAGLQPRLADTQFGFRARRSTADAVLQLLTSLQYLSGLHNQPSEKGRQRTARRQHESQGPSIEAAASRAQPRQSGQQATTGSHRKLRCAALFLDIQKAFDRVDHDILLERLHHVGVRNAAHRWIRSFLTGRRMRCVDNQYEAGWQPVRYGVPQGCVLSPLLFLIFINDLIHTINADDRCRLISALFYADDGVLGPRLERCRPEFDRLGRSVKLFEAEYGRQLARAAAHLDSWCASSRMRFGQEKTQVVVFNRGNSTNNGHFDTIWLCGYTVALAPDYEYLGVTLTSDFTWHKHAKHKVALARAAASRVTSVAINARPVQPAVIRELVRACVVPAYDYLAEFWGLGLPEETTRAFQAAVAKPLRTALELPLTTHQHSVLYGCGVPAWYTHVQHKQLSSLRRVSRLLADDPQHPTARLYKYAHAEMSGEHAQLLDVHAALPLPVSLLTSVLPYAGVDAAGGPMADDIPRTAVSPTQWAERRKHARTQAVRGKAGEAAGRHRRSQLQHTWAALQAMYQQELVQAAAQDGDLPRARGRYRAGDELRRVRREAARLEWTESHMPAAAEDRDRLSATKRSRCTTAPITQCAGEPATDTAPPLHFLHRKHTLQLKLRGMARRARLLYNRAYTATLRHRFPSDAAAADGSTLCTHGLCTAAGQDETAEHVLLHCPRYSVTRDRLRCTLADCGLALTLANTLNPPAHGGRRRFLALYRAGNAFLRSIDATRQRLLLPSLNSCPRYDNSRQPRHSARPQVVPAPVAAHAAPLPLDTG